MNKDEYLYYQNTPSAFFRDFLEVNPWEKQDEIAQALQDDFKVAVRSGHDLGKTFIAACILLWFIFTHFRSKVVTTAPTFRQVKLLWSEVAVLHAKLKEKVEPAGDLLQTGLNIGPGHWAVGFSTDQPSNFQGIHEKDLLLIVDEACGVAREIFEASEGIITTPGNRVLAIGNPTDPNTYFHWMFTGKIPGYRKIKLSCFDSPNITVDEVGNYVDREPLPYPKLVTMAWITEKIRTYGVESPFVQARVLAEFPESATQQLLDGRYVALAVQKGILLRKIVQDLEDGGQILSSEQIAQLTGAA